MAIVKDIAQKCGVSMDWLCGVSAEYNNIETYSHIIEVLTSIAKKLSVDVEVCNQIDDAVNLRIKDTVMVAFAKEWVKIKNLYADGVIDNSLYQLWLEKQLKYYDCYIGETPDESITYNETGEGIDNMGRTHTKKG
jgi:hypothetical protein